MREAAPCGLDSAPPDAAGWRRSTPPLPSGAWEFCSAAIARNAGERQGKISVERRRRKATRAKASGSRQERLQWGKAVSPRGTHAKNVRFESATVAGRNLRHEQGGRYGLRLSQGEAVSRMLISARSKAGLLSR